MALRGPKMSQDGPKMAQDGPKMAPRWSQDDAKMDKMVLSCRRRAHFAKSAMPSSVGTQMIQDRPKTSQDGPKMAPRWSQDDAKMEKMALSCRRGANFAKSAMHRLSSDVVSLKWHKIDPG